MRESQRTRQIDSSCVIYYHRTEDRATIKMIKIRRPITSQPNNFPKNRKLKLDHSEDNSDARVPHVSFEFNEFVPRQLTKFGDSKL